MGGRGQSTRRTGITTPAAPAPATPPEAETVTELAKNPKDPLTYEDLYSDRENIVNPNYGYSPEYSANCQTCVLAAELNARGIYVEATGYTGNRASGEFKKNSDSWINLFPESMRQDIFNRSLFGLQGDLLGNPRVSAKDLEADILKQMSNGQRGLLRAHTPQTGHLVNFEVKSGKVQVFDPQSGAMMDLKTFIDGGDRTVHMFSGGLRETGTRYNMAGFMRIDNIPIITDSDLAREYFKPRKTK